MENHNFSWENPLYITIFSCFFLENPDVPQDLSISTRRLGASVRLNAVKLPEAGNDSLRKQGTRSILHGYFNPLVFWY
jgi:hypothetical protein